MNLEERCQKAVMQIAKNVGDIKNNVRDMSHKLSHFLQNYREDYYDAMQGTGYQKQLKEYRKK